MVAAGELKKVRSSGSRVDEMLKRSETADDIAAFGRLHVEDAQAGYFDAEKNEWVEGDVKSTRGRSKVSAVIIGGIICIILAKWQACHLATSPHHNLHFLLCAN